MKLQKLFLFFTIISISNPLATMNWWREPKEERIQTRQQREQNATEQLVNLLERAVGVSWKSPSQDFFKQAQELLNKGANPNALVTIRHNSHEFDFKAGDKLPLLEYAVSLGYPEIVHMLLDHGAYAKNLEGNTALKIALNTQGSDPVILQKMYEIISLLLEHGANPNQTIQYNRDRYVPLLLHILSYGNSDSQLKKILYNQIAKKLIEYGADVNANENKSIYGFGTPLIQAQDSKITSMLLDLGANPSIMDLYGFTALTEAIHNKNWPKLFVLLDHNVDVNQPNKSSLLVASAVGCTPLEMLIRTNADPKIAERLLLAGADINAQDRQGNTALMYAIFMNKAPMIKLLLENGAHTTIRNNENQTALDIAIIKNAQGIGNQAIINLLQNPPSFKKIRELTPASKEAREKFKEWRLDK